jgi:hypothetical protein
LEIFKLLDQITTAVKDGKYNYLVYGLCLLLMTWLYKHFKTYMSEQDKENLKRLDTALEVYGNIYVQLDNIILGKGDIESFKCALSKSYIYLPKETLKQALDLDLDFSNNKALKEFKTLVKNEILQLKSQQLDSVTYRISNNIYENMEYYINKSKFKLLYTPFVYSLFAFIGIFFAVSLITVFSATNWLNRLILIVALFYFILFFFVAAGIFQSIVNKNFNFQYKNIALILALVIAPFIGTIYLSKYILFMAFICLITYTKFHFRSTIKK